MIYTDICVWRRHDERQGQSAEGRTFVCCAYSRPASGYQRRDTAVGDRDRMAEVGRNYGARFTLDLLYMPPLTVLV